MRLLTGRYRPPNARSIALIAGVAVAAFGRCALADSWTTSIQSIPLATTSTANPPPASAWTIAMFPTTNTATGTATRIAAVSNYGVVPGATGLNDAFVVTLTYTSPSGTAPAPLPPVLVYGNAIASYRVVPGGTTSQTPAPEVDPLFTYAYVTDCFGDPQLWSDFHFMNMDGAIKTWGSQHAVRSTGCQYVNPVVTKINSTTWQAQWVEVEHVRVAYDPGTLINCPRASASGALTAYLAVAGTPLPGQAPPGLPVDITTDSSNNVMVMWQPGEVQTISPAGSLLGTQALSSSVTARPWRPIAFSTASEGSALPGSPATSVISAALDPNYQQTAPNGDLAMSDVGAASNGEIRVFTPSNVTGGVLIPQDLAAGSLGSVLGKAWNGNSFSAFTTMPYSSLSAQTYSLAGQNFPTTLDTVTVPTSASWGSWMFGPWNPQTFLALNGRIAGTGPNQSNWRIATNPFSTWDGVIRTLTTNEDGSFLYSTENTGLIPYASTNGPLPGQTYTWSSPKPWNDGYYARDMTTGADNQDRVLMVNDQTSQFYVITYSENGLQPPTVTQTATSGLFSPYIDTGGSLYIPTRITADSNNNLYVLLVSNDGLNPAAGGGFGIGRAVVYSVTAGTYLGPFTY